MPTCPVSESLCEPMSREVQRLHRANIDNSFDLLAFPYLRRCLHNKIWVHVQSAQVHFLAGLLNEGTAHFSMLNLEAHFSAGFMIALYRSFDHRHVTIALGS